MIDVYLHFQPTRKGEVMGNVMGARSVLQRAVGKSDPLSRWALAVRARRGYHRACIAVASKNARVLWAMLSHHSHSDAAAP